ncbi:hypothetical protein ACTL6P_08725 [Endozoicomonas acroporae]|uniref:hypothetical protein n=1 Tax=Endozoicomonas acroporae TaxID=1701104 RepID=UPI0015E06DB4|nr:hypothetical protein [Endozoicomonas acroporae]
MVYLTNKRHLINLLAQLPQQRLEHGKGKNKLPHTDTAAGKRYQMGRAYWVGLSYTLMVTGPDLTHQNIIPMTEPIGKASCLWGVNIYR